MRSAEQHGPIIWCGHSKECIQRSSTPITVVNWIELKYKLQTLALSLGIDLRGRVPRVGTGAVGIVNTLYSSTGFRLADPQCPPRQLETCRHLRLSQGSSSHRANDEHGYMSEHEACCCHYVNCVQSKSSDRDARPRSTVTELLRCSISQGSNDDPRAPTTMSFIPRATFQYPLLTPSWFAGHMAKSLREMGTLLQDIDLVIEARDARLPLTSINRAFDAVLEKSWGRRMDLDALSGDDGESSTSGRRSGPNMGYNVGGKGKERLVVYTKKDLAEERYEKVSF